MTALIFLDTETLGLRLIDPIWEVAAIRREPDGTETVLHFHLLDGDGRRPEPAPDFPEQFRADFRKRYGQQELLRRDVARDRLWSLFADRPHVIGAVPNFDTERIYHQLGMSGWHYHLIDVENMAVGYLAGKGLPLPALPWDSDDLSRSVGIDPDHYVRHSALDDARWARDIYDTITKENS